MNRSTRNWFIASVMLVAVAALTLLVSFSPTANTPPKIEGASVTGAQMDEAQAGTRATGFTVTAKQAGDVIGLDFRGSITKGNLTLQLVDSSGKTAWEMYVKEPGAFSITTSTKAPAAGDYSLRIKWDSATQATYSLVWRPGEITAPEISPLVFVPGMGMMLVALGFVVYAVWRKLSIGYLALGALGWVLAIILKFAWAIPLNAPIYRALNDALPEGIANATFDLYVGALTGVFEVAVIWLIARYTKLGKATWKQVLAFGIGFGAVEAVMLGLLNSISMATAYVAPQLFPVVALEEVAKANSLLYGLAPISERFFTILVHVLSNVLIFYSIATHRISWFWAAFIYKSAIDALAAFAQLAGLNTLAAMWSVEFAVAVWGFIGWLGTRWIAAHYPTETPTPLPPSTITQAPTPVPI